MKLDIIIPCYNAEQTLERAVQSCLIQPELNTLWLIDDASTDGTWALIQSLKQQFPQKIQAQKLPENGGVAQARNWGALKSEADLIAFLDADDAYEPHALAAAYFSFGQFPYIGLIRLRLKPVDLPEHYANHAQFSRAWHDVAMTVGGNTVFRRAFFWACGGFPQDNLFRQLGGEDGALGIATVQASVVATLFDENEPAVLHFCRQGMHAERLLNAHLFQMGDPRITPELHAQAEAVTAKIVAGLHSTQLILNQNQNGVMPLHVNRAND